MAEPERKDPLSAEDTPPKSNGVDKSLIYSRKNENGDGGMEKQGANGSSTVANNEVAVTVGAPRSSEGTVQSAVRNYQEKHVAKNRVDSVRHASKGPGSPERTMPKKATSIQMTTLRNGQRCLCSTLKTKSAPKICRKKKRRRRWRTQNAVAGCHQMKGKMMVQQQWSTMNCF
jgi:hypothetical protein